MPAAIEIVSIEIAPVVANSHSVYVDHRKHVEVVFAEKIVALLCESQELTYDSFN